MGASPLPWPIEAGRCAAWSATALERESWPSAGSSCTRATCSTRSLRGAGRGVEVAYYLIHSMGRGAAGDFEQRDRQGAGTSRGWRSDEGVGRVVYLGGLGDRPQSRHLRSRHETALILASLGRR